MNNKQSLYLLWVTILNQSQKAEEVIQNTKTLMQRLGMINNFDEHFRDLSYKRIEDAMNYTTKLHRFPRNMSMYLYSSVIKIEKENIHINEIFEGKENEVKERLQQFQGIGEHKVKVAIALLKIYNSKEIKKEMENLNCPRIDETMMQEFSILDELGVENKKEIGEER